MILKPEAQPTAQTPNITMKTMLTAIISFLIGFQSVKAQTMAHNDAPDITPFDHIFMVLLENVGYEAVIGNSVDAPYINNTLLPRGTLYTMSFGISHPSLPNYLALFSGSTRGVTNDSCSNGPFQTPNLYARMANAGLTIQGLMENLPYHGFEGCTDGYYVKKHNPFPFFAGVPGLAWVKYHGLPAVVPNVAFIVPNTRDDMHDGENVHIQVQRGDQWLSGNLPQFIRYGNANNGLVILTMDEGQVANHIPTLLIGPRIAHGATNNIQVNHYNVLKTITDNFGLQAIGNCVGLPGLY
jgi:phosphatidylinositol-3-phosphatase